MKTTFRRRYSVGASYGKRFAYVAAALLLGASAVMVSRSQIITLVRPLWLADNAVSRWLGSATEYFWQKDTLIKDNQALRERLAEHESLLAAYRTLEASREELLASFGRSEAATGIAAGVLSHPPETPYDVLVLDAGAEDGVQPGASVSLPAGGALGFISEVLDGESKASLYSGSGIETPAYLERGDVPVTLKGRGGGAFEFVLPRDIAVEAGDKILLPGLRAELLAIVREVVLEATDSEKWIVASGPGSISSIRFVTIR